MSIKNHVLLTLTTGNNLECNATNSVLVFLLNRNVPRQLNIGHAGDVWELADKKKEL